MLKASINRSFTMLKHLKIYAGVDPDRVTAPALIFFPRQANVLCCGLAGILTIKETATSKCLDPETRLSPLFEIIRRKSLKEVFDGIHPSADYLQGPDTLAEMEQCIAHLKQDRALERLFFDPASTTHLIDRSKEMNFFLEGEQFALDNSAVHLNSRDMEIINSRLTRLKDICWMLEKDIISNIRRILELSGAGRPQDLSPEAFRKYRRMNFLLNCLDRLEVRGRDSAGIQISFTLSSMESREEILKLLKEKGLQDSFHQRTKTGDLINGAIQCSGMTPFLSFTYKTASIIGELGRNIRELRKYIANDVIFREFAGGSVICETSLAHTRWASVGSITEENCHPVNNHTINDAAIRHYPSYGDDSWTINAVLNGDIDNYQALRHRLETAEELITPEVTTDTKIIPLLIDHYLRAGHDLTEAFRLAVLDFEGSHAIAMTSNLEPTRIFLALKGSGQSIYVGLAPDRYVYSSELYGLVEETPSFIKMDGEKCAIPGDPGSTGQIMILDQNAPGGLSGIKSFHYNGLPCILQEKDIKQAEMTTRDIDRGAYPHFFLKEITESTLSVHKTLLGKYRILTDGNGHPQVRFNIGPDIIPERILRALKRGEIHRILVIGHGTAAVAGMAVADAMTRYLRGSRIGIEAIVASELSGFYLQEDLHDTLILPITQSGTTTDTNRAVAMAAERGAPIIAIVNRRQSDITGKADGVFYTSDGRDIEMSVASTKAFYSQIIAGHILSLYLAQMLRTLSDDKIARELHTLETAPAMMKRVLNQKERIRESVRDANVQRKYWAVVGSGPNKAAADEVRIKLSELCYKTISSDVVENKKHIDLSAEPLILVCAAGSPKTVADDIVKDVAIFKAHKAGIVVFADEEEERFHAVADSVVPIPRAEMPLPVILNTIAGHLWGYFAACRIDEESLFFREFRSHLNLMTIEQTRRNYSLYDGIFDRNFRRMIGEFATRFHERRNKGDFSVISVKTMTDIVLLLKYAMGKLPLEDFWSDFAEADGIASPVDLLDISLGHAVDELSRPIDAIRHQAKTVTVGTSRKEQPLQGIIYDLLNELGFTTRLLISKNILTISRIQPAIAAIKGYTLYDINHLDSEGNPADGTTISIRKRGGISLQMRSRTEGLGLLMGTKRTIVSMGHVYIGRGKTDGAPILIIPLLSEGSGIGSLLLIHIVFNESLGLTEKIATLGYRFNDLRNMINEYNLPWHDRYLDSIPLEALFSEPIEIIAGQIQSNLATSDEIFC